MRRTRAMLAATVLAALLVLGACAAPTAQQGPETSGTSTTAPSTGSADQQETQMPSQSDQTSGSEQGGGGAAAGGAQNPGLEGSSWTLKELNGQAPLPDQLPTLEFREGRVGGMSSCNRYMGGFTADDTTISFSRLAGTMMACEQGLMDQEQAYLRLLERGTGYTIAGDTLTITADDGASLVFVRA